MGHGEIDDGIILALFIGPNGILGDNAVLLRCLSADFPFPDPDQLLPLCQLLLCISISQITEIDTGLLIDLIHQISVTHQLHQNIGLYVFLGKGLGNDFRRIPLMPRLIYIKIRILAGLKCDGLGLPAHGIRHNTLQTSLQQKYPCLPAIQDADPAAGTADTGDHGGGSDVKSLITFQWNSHIKEDAAGIDKHLQLLALFAQLCLTVLIQLDCFRAVQTQPRIAGIIRDLMIAAVKPHILCLHQLFLFAVHHCDIPLRLHQTNGGGLILGSQRHSRDGTCDQNNQKKRPDDP